MITLGIDSGNQNTKAVMLQDGKIVGRAMTLTEFDANKAAMKVCEMVLADGRVKKDEIAVVAATGAGRSTLELARGNVNEIGSAVRGARFVNPNTFLVIDLGAEACRAVRLTPEGKVKNYEVNDKCASGAGTFIETMARALQITTAEMGPLSMKCTKNVPMNAQCVVFAESEVISLIHQKESIEDIANGIHIGIANRISSMVRRVGIVDGVTLIGGPGHNIGLVKCLKNELAKEIAVPADTDYISALGAAIYATEIA